MCFMKTETSTIHHLAVKGGCGCYFWLGMQQLRRCFPGNIPSQLLLTWRGPYCSISWTGKPPSIQEIELQKKHDNCSKFWCTHACITHLSIHLSPTWWPCLFHRTYLAMILIMAKKGVWVLEQPASSLVFRLPCFQELCRTVKDPQLQFQMFCMLKLFVEFLKSDYNLQSAHFYRSTFLHVGWIPRFTVRASGWGAGGVRPQKGQLCGQTQLQ